MLRLEAEPDFSADFTAVNGSSAISAEFANLPEGNFVKCHAIAKQPPQQYGIGGKK
ncbi:MAG: hypothetical protein HY074_20845 [Deltaproteobacteria bacterium]|nr:hypothetical protein [Deltaproteobacteria bacterium]